MVWGVRRAWRGQGHSHLHAHADGTLHLHHHSHQADHLHPHSPGEGHVDTRNQGAGQAHPSPEPEAASLTPWVLFVIFLLGPCEALIPLLMFPAATDSFGVLLLVTATFGVATVGTMLGIVLAGLEGVQRLPVGGLERWSHTLAGFIILLCGVAIRFLGI
jgi:ABC-type nickel/cobalt efflux system permease component RcnA